ncbi:MAG: DUF5694 domain-containing protein [Rhodospirillaceae bacterium]
MRNIVMLLCGLMLATVPARAQDLLIDRAPEARPSLLILASPHLHNPGRDARNVVVDDVLMAARQAQLEDLVNQLAAYRPTHVAIEHVASEQDKIDQAYRAYRAGTRVLERDEEEQIGMRLAAKLGLDRVIAVDWNGMPPGDFDANYAFAAYAKQNGTEARLQKLRNSPMPFPPIEKTAFVPYYLAINQPDTLLKAHRIHFDVAMIDDAAAQPAANWIGTWYARNLKIFMNLVKITDDPNARVLTIFGAGHAHILRQYATDSGAFRLREVSEFVKAP